MYSMETNHPINSRFPSIYMDRPRICALLQTFPVTLENILEYPGALWYCCTKAGPPRTAGPPFSHADVSRRGLRNILLQALGLVR